MTRPVFLAAVATALSAAALAGCSVFKSNEEAQAIVTRRVTGMPAGEFFDRYGRFKSRFELPSGGAAYNWQSGVGSVKPGITGQDERVCIMRILADKAGRIESATVVIDNPGRTSTSRCGEMFKDG